MKKFWLVYDLNSEEIVTYQELFATAEEARECAQKYCEVEGSTFVVMESKGFCSPPPKVKPVWEDKFES